MQKLTPLTQRGCKNPLKEQQRGLHTAQRFLCKKPYPKTSLSQSAFPTAGTAAHRGEYRRARGLPRLRPSPGLFEVHAENY